MSEELGQIQKPSVEEFKGGKRLFFVPLIYCGQEAPAEYVEKFDEYWKQVEEQICNLELKLGKVRVILHEFVAAGGEEGMQAIKGLNDKSYELAKEREAQGARVEALEDSELLAEMMDWSRCISVGLQSRKAFAGVYDSYIEVSKSRNEHMAGRIDEVLGFEVSGLIFMREGHQVQFPGDIEVFYVAPPGLDEIKRWVRDNQAKQAEEASRDKQQ